MICILLKYNKYNVIQGSDKSKLYKCIYIIIVDKYTFKFKATYMLPLR